MYSRQSYSDKSLNTDTPVWNLRVAKKFLKGRLSVMLNSFDILDNISDIRQALNAQGRTETWPLSIPRYAILHAVYRLSKSPHRQ